MLPLIGMRDGIHAIANVEYACFPTFLLAFWWTGKQPLRDSKDLSDAQYIVPKQWLMHDILCF